MLPIGLLFRPPQLQVHQGGSTLTSLQLLDNPIVIPAGTTQSFYMQSDGGIGYMNGSSEGSIYASDEKNSWKGLANLVSLEAPFTCASGMVESYTWSFWMECHLIATPVKSPSDSPSGEPSIEPSQDPSGQPSITPSVDAPSNELSQDPSAKLSLTPSDKTSLSLAPSVKPSSKPSLEPSSVPSMFPSSEP
jgi:hypothetical protein